jgi:hypothetical protein
MSRMRKPTSLMFFLATALVFGQKGGGGGQSGGQGGQQNGASSSQGGSGGGSQGLQGLSYPVTEWSQLGLPNIKGPIRTYPNGRAVLCYKLATSNSSSTPFVLQPMTAAEVSGTGFDRPCGQDGLAESDSQGRKSCREQEEKASNRKHPKLLVDESQSHWNACSFLDQNHPLLMGQELVIGIEVSDLGLSGVNYNQLKALNINVVNQATSALNPSPLRPSFPGTSSGGSGGGSAGNYGGVDYGLPKGFWWIPAGRVVPGTDTFPHWEENHTYEKGDLVADEAGTHLYRAGRHFKTGLKPVDPFPARPRADRVKDGTIIWQEVNKPPDGVTAEEWRPAHPYLMGTVVKVKRSGIPDDTVHYIALAKFALADPTPTSVGNPNSAILAAATTISRILAKFGGEKYFYRAMSTGTSGNPKDPLSVEVIPRAIYLQWPYQLPGDIIPTFNVNLVYSPPMPGAPWQGDTYYPAGSVITSTTNNGHYYTALTGGFSSPEPNEPVLPADAPPVTQDGDVFWLDSGTSAPTTSGASQTGGGVAGGGGQGAGGSGSGGKAQLWIPRSHYALGDTIIDPRTGHYFTMVRSKAGISGNRPTTGTEPFPAIANQTILKDGDLLWLQLPPGVNPANVVTWSAKHFFDRDQEFRSYVNGLYYRMVGSTATTGNSGTNEPFTNPPVMQHFVDGNLAWMDSGATAPGSGRTWKPTTPFSLGDSAVGSDHKVYVVVGAGASGQSQPVAGTAPGQAGSLISDGDLLWMDLGRDASRSGWVPDHPYGLDAIVSGANGDAYQVVRFTAGVSGPPPADPSKTMPDLAILAQKTAIEAASQAVPSDNGITWLDRGVIRPIGITSTPGQWKANQQYSPGIVIFVPGIGNGRYYEASYEGPILSSGSRLPFANLTPQFPLTWQNSGTTAPSLVSGTPAPDQTVSLINLSLPQTHSLSYFNVAAGVLGVIQRPLTFGYVQATDKLKAANTTPATVPAAASGLAVDPATGCTTNGVTSAATLSYFCPARTGYAARVIDPVLMLTLYFPPVDAEQQWQINNVRNWIPGLSFGASLSNPTGYFYVGGSNEAGIRNVQIVWGLAWQKVAIGLANPLTQPVYGGLGTIPTVNTVSGFHRGLYLGITYNLANFIQSLGISAAKSTN